MADGDTSNQPIDPTTIEPILIPPNINHGNPDGRPTVMTEKVLEDLRKAFMVGATDRQACAYAGISAGTLYNYQVQYPEYLEQKENWKDHPIMKARATVYGKLGEIETAKWFLERKAKDEFSPRGELTGPGGERLLPALFDKIEKTNYDDMVNEAQKQVVAPQQPLQGQGQEGQPGDVPSQSTTVQTSDGETGSPAKSDIES